MYVDIVKAASSSIRRALHRPPLGASWDNSLSGSPCGASPREKSHERTTTACWTAAQLRERFAAGGVWSVVREPSVKFESGVRQMWAQGNVSRDDLPTADAAGVARVQPLAPTLHQHLRTFNIVTGLWEKKRTPRPFSLT